MQHSKEKNKTPRVEFSKEHCKGCGLCATQCPVAVIKYSNEFNSLGYKYAEYVGEGCKGCGFCFYACPEPSAVTVYKA